MYYTQSVVLQEVNSRLRIGWSFSSTSITSTKHTSFLFFLFFFFFVLNADMGGKAAAPVSSKGSVDESQDEKPYIQVQNTNDIGQIKRVFDECVVAVRNLAPTAPPHQQQPRGVLPWEH